MPDHQRLEAKLAPLVQQMPELRLISLGAAGHIHQIDSDRSLVESAVVFMAAVRVHALGIRSEKRPASHAGVHIPVLQLPHDLGADVVRHHTFRGTLGSHNRQVPVRRVLGHVVLVQDIDQFRECGRHPHPDLILDALVSLVERLRDDQRQIIPGLAGRNLVQIHEHGDKRRLTVGGEQRLNLILDRLDAPLHFLLYAHLRYAADLGFRVIPADGIELLPDLPLILLAGHIHEGSKMRQGDRLSAVGVGCHLRDDLRGDVASGRKTVWLLDQGVCDHGPVLEHVLQIDQLTV